MNKKMIIPSLIMLLTVGCKNSNSDSNIVRQTDRTTDTVLVSRIDSTSIIKEKQKTEQEVKEVAPDTTINKILMLENGESLQKFYKDYKMISTVDRLRESPIVIFSNSDKSQYLLAYQYEGGSKNNFSCFEIGYFDNDKKLSKDSSYNTSDRIFQTESKLVLGLSLDEIIKIKGDGYKSKDENGETIITYRIDDYEKSPFLLRYNMPGYFIEFRLKNNKATRITFGFDYP
ncbi:hypothetical protein [Flavobacterium sp. CAU 1735]|uniref:hypothetical protein n=1 Tax=Flavobacterium sp. CAU 1735 TaxID=3140361 RepID=UPI003260038A